MNTVKASILFFAATGIAGMPGAFAADPAFVRGDVNLDGDVSLADVGYMIHAIFFQGPSPRCVDAADVDDDGQFLNGGRDDAKRLLDWLLRSGPQPSQPFPKPGPDPTSDQITCVDATLIPRGKPEPGFAFDWDGPAYLQRKQKDVELFVEVTTDAPMMGFSIAVRVDRAVLTNLRVDFKGTILPAQFHSVLTSSSFFGSKVTQSSDPKHDLLLVAVMFLAPTSQLQLNLAGGAAPIPFAATQGPIASARLLRVLADVRADAPLTGSETTVVEPATAADLLPGVAGALHGLRDELLLGPDDPRRRSLLPSGIFHLVPVIAEEGEFLRGDGNDDRRRDISDARFTLNYLFLGGPAPRCPDAADTNDDGVIDVSDGVYLLSYLFSGGREPPEVRIVRECACSIDITGDGLGRCESSCDCLGP